ncbi:MAG TPA: hypothetical protein VGW12_17030 [Pyrinomonadaceae bacterium]|nr:hypothetical protein [Pyrinomonadaceae bacterium]
MRHPFERIPQGVRRRLFLPALVVTSVIVLTWIISVSPMANERAPLSVSSFGMAGSLARAREMMASWDERTRLSGAFGIGFDFLQLVVYAATVGMACAWVAQSFREGGRTLLSSVGVLLAWGLWLAVLCGTVQNGVMISLLLGSGSESWMRVSYWCTLLKLLLLLLAPAYALVGWLAQYRATPTGRA